MSAGPVIPFVAGGAIRRIRRTGPRDNLIVSGMTGLAGKRYAMVAGIIARGMPEGDGGNPCRGVMADITLLGSDKVTGILAGGGSAVVACGTGAADTGVVKARRCPCSGGVTGIALRRRGDVIDRFAGGTAAVMTSRAGSTH